MIKFKLNNKAMTMASSWPETKFKEYIELFDLKTDDYAQLISIFTGVDKATVEKARINGLDRVLSELSFLNTPPDFKTYKATTLCGTPMPKDVTFEHLAPFEDMRMIIKMDLEHDKNGEFRASAICKAEYCAIYLQYMRDKEYDSEKAKALMPEVMNAPAMDVISLGSFFLIRHLLSNTSMIKSSPTTRKSRKKQKPTLKNSMKRSARTRR